VAVGQSIAIVVTFCLDRFVIKQITTDTTDSGERGWRVCGWAHISIAVVLFGVAFWRLLKQRPTVPAKYAEKTGEKETGGATSGQKW
jgi:hypothetical protein